MFLQSKSKRYECHKIFLQSVKIGGPLLGIVASLTAQETIHQASKWDSEEISWVSKNNECIVVFVYSATSQNPHHNAHPHPTPAQPLPFSAYSVSPVVSTVVASLKAQHHYHHSYASS